MVACSMPISAFGFWHDESRSRCSGGKPGKCFAGGVGSDSLLPKQQTSKQGIEKSDIPADLIAVSTRRAHAMLRISMLKSIRQYVTHADHL
jgi:hypothetical protein